MWISPGNTWPHGASERFGELPIGKLSVQGGSPQTIAKLVPITPITMVFVGDISIVNEVYKPIYC